MEYDIVYADPPWFYTPNSTAKLPYKSMSMTELCEFPIGELLAPKGILFVWVTCPLLMGQQAIVTEEWCERYGLHYRGMPFIWIKTKQDGTPLKAQGVRATITKPNVEFVLAFSRVIRGRPIKIADEKICQTVFAPKAEHSAKPAEVRSRIDGLYPRSSKVELFHRGVSPQGWDTWGNEAKTPIDWDPENY